MDIHKLKEITEDLTVLYVEDEPDVRTRMLRLLENFFKQIRCAENGYEALKLYKEKTPDIVITDIMMPVMDGIKMAKEIKKLSPYQSIIIISAYNEVKYFTEAISIGIDGFVVKPVSGGQLFDTIMKTALKIQLENENLTYKAHLEELVRKKTEETTRLLVTDELTGLYNHVKLNEILQGDGQKVLLLMNLDNFVQINTTYGYETGNEVLKEIGAFFNAKKPENTMLFRLTSDEFVLLFTDKLLHEVDEVATRLHNMLYEERFILKNGVLIRLTVTMAVVEGVGSELLKNAQIALLKARAIGKNRLYTVHDVNNLKCLNTDNIYWINRVRSALENGTIFPYFQPIYNNKTKKVEKYECLCRIVEDGEIITPFKFLEPAKLAGLIPQITATMVKKSFTAFSKTDIEFSINITDDDLNDSSLLDILEDILKQHDLHPGQVAFEVLENISVGSSKNIVEQLKRLKDRGFKIAVDDFGAEYSSFSRIMDLQADFVKIDGRFIKNLDNDPKSYTIANAIAMMARSIGMKIVAEFVHSKEVQDKVVELGIDYSQGYYLGKPEASIK